MFKPYEIIFVPTQQCNLRCPHCFVPNNETRLNIDSAERFLETAADNGIERIGFSGGEPFLYPEFLQRITAFAVDKAMYFDRIMTNAAWFTSQEHLESVLQSVYDAGFDGTICISFDAFHNQDPQKVRRFIETVFSIWKDRRVIELTAVRSISETDNSVTFSMIDQLSHALEAVPEKKLLHTAHHDFPHKIVFDKPLDNAFIYYEDENDSISIQWIDQTGEKPEDPLFWDSIEWFAEDYCEGPGQVLYVHADGSIAPCCGYANENEKLRIGSIYEMTVEQVLEKAASMDIIHTVFDEGLLKEAKKMEKNNCLFPGSGKTQNNCQFCAYFLNQKKE